MPPTQAPPKLVLPSDEARRIDRAAARGYPYEVCGLLLGERSESLVRVARAIRVPNRSPDRRRDRYVLDPRGYLRVDRAASRLGLEIVGVWHTHPDAPARPSATDAEWSWPSTSYLIVSVSETGVRERRSWEIAAGSGGFAEQAMQHQIANAQPADTLEAQPIGAEQP